MKLCAKCRLLSGAYICGILCPKREMMMSLFDVSQYFRQKDWIFKSSLNFFHIAGEA